MFARICLKTIALDDEIATRKLKGNASQGNLTVDLFSSIILVSLLSGVVSPLKRVSSNYNSLIFSGDLQVL
jgi:hypothetical protein